jgi:tetratricopeptide (TPR) repeat protein
LEVLEEALDARVVEELPGASRYQFTHALIQATLADELSRTRQARLHARIAHALEGHYGDRAVDHAAELAHHFGEAEAVLGADGLVRYSALAGEAALAAHAPEQALAHFERALAAKGNEVVDDQTAELVFGLGRAQAATLPPHKLEPAIASLRRAFDHYAASGDVGRAAAIAAYPLPLSLRFGYTDAEELISQGLALVSSGAHEAGAVLAQHAWFSGFIKSDYNGAQRAFRQALSIARRDGDAALERRTLANAAFVDAFHLRWQDCLERGLRAIELAQQAGDTRTEIPARRAVGFALVATGEREQARVHTATALALAKPLRESWWLTSSSFSNELLCLYEGDWRAARELGELGLAAEPGDPRHLALRAMLEYELGDGDGGAAYLARLHEVAESVPPPGPIADYIFVAAVTPLIGRITGAAAALDWAETAAQRVLSLLPRLTPALTLYARSGLGLIAAERGDANAAEQLYGELAAAHGTASFFVPLAADRLLGLLAAAHGRLDAAAAHFTDGLAFCARAGYRPQYAWTACDFAELLVRRAAEGDRAKAEALQGEALGIANDLGMRPLAERVLARRELLEA